MAYSFNGNQSLSASRPSEASAEPLTIALWFKNNRNTAYENVFGIYSNTNDRILCSFLCNGVTANDPVEADKYSNSGAYAAASRIGFVTSSWQQGCGVYESDSSRVAYLNGTGGAANTATVGTVTSAVIRIAAASSTAANGVKNLFEGAASECAIWNVGLTAAEISSLSKGFKPTRIRPQSLVFYAPLIRNLQDVRGGLTITNNNSATVADHQRVY